jgi:tripartite ATP-independent transporter DctP family solute receptor
MGGAPALRRETLKSISRRRFLATASAGTLALTASLSTSLRAQSTITMRISSSMSADQNAAHYIWYERFANNLQGAVGERVKLGYFPDSQLGKEADIVQQVKVGSIDMMITGSSIWATVAPEFGMLDLGYVFDSYPHAFKALDGGVGPQLGKILFDHTGCTVLDWASHFGPRSVYTKNPVKGLADLKGVKLRVLPAPAFIETFKIMGAIPTPIPINELYTALQTGVVDGFEHDAASVLQYKFAEQVKYCWLTEHLFSPMVCVIGKHGLEKVPADMRPAFLKAANDATVYERGVAAEKGKAATAELMRLGVTFTPMAKAEREQVRKEMEVRVWASFIKEYPVTQPMFDAIAAART